MINSFIRNKTTWNFIVISLLIQCGIVIVMLPSYADTYQVGVPIATSKSNCFEDDRCYSPYKITIDAGDTVTWTNADYASHTVTSGTYSDGLDGIFDSGTIPTGQTFSHTFTVNGTYHYYCTIYEWMEGEIIVGDGLGDPKELLEQIGIVISTDKQFYDFGDIITISANRGSMLKIYDPDFNLVTTEEGFPDKLFISGPLWKTEGEYTLIVNDGSDSTQTTFFVGIEEIVLPQKETITISNPRMVDDFGSTVNEPSVDRKVQITSDITNNLNKKQPFAYVLIVEDENGVFSQPKWITGTLDSGQTLQPSLSWTPDSAQWYNVTISVWGDPVSQNQLSEPASFIVDLRNDSVQTETAQTIKTSPDFVDPEKGAQYYLDRYNDEPSYKDWFDRNYPGYTIEDAIEMAIPDAFKVDSQQKLTASSERPVEFEPVATSERVVFHDEEGQAIEELSVDQKVEITTTVTNESANEQEFVFLAQIKNSNGQVVSINFITGTLSKDMTLEPSLHWNPDRSGTYTTELFVWDDLDDANPLSDSISSQVIVR